MDAAKGPSQTSALLKLYHFIKLMAAAFCKTHNFIRQLLYCPLHACKAALLQKNTDFIWQRLLLACV